MLRGSAFSACENAKHLLLGVLDGRREDVLRKISARDSPGSAFFTSLNQTRRGFYSAYLDTLGNAVSSGEMVDLPGYETFQSYSPSQAGSSIEEIILAATCARNAVIELLIELVRDGEVEGVIAVEAIALLNEMTDQAVTVRALSFVRMMDEAFRSYNAYQEEIDRFPGDLASTLDLETLMRSAVRKCVDLVGVERCALLTRDPATGEFLLRASNFEGEPVFCDGTVALDEQLIQLLDGERPVTIEGYPRSSPLVSALMKKIKTRELLLVPLLVRDRNTGFLMLCNVERHRPFTADIADVAMRFANKVAATMENARLHNSEQRKLKETIALLEVSRLVASTLDVDVLLTRLVQITTDVCEVGKCSVYLLVPEDGRFYPAATFGTYRDPDWETSLLDGVAASELPDEEVVAVLERYEIVVSDPDLSPFIPRERIQDTGVRSVVLVPMSTRDRLMGLIVLFSGKGRDELGLEDFNLVNTVAGQAAVALDNASLYEDLEMSYLSTVRALARAIEVKDPYMYGHSERVSDYALAIARRLGLTGRECRSIRYAAALHDIGKIGIARRILDKPGALTEEEFLHIKTHPRLGESIVAPVTFLEDPRRIILHHHERFDGRGYPDGLKGEEIPLGARILAVADAFEAMLSERPYRKALPVSEAVKELEVNSGTQFDAAIVKAFLEALRTGDLTEGTQRPKPWMRIPHRSSQSFG